jgi:hypothetical protein
VTPPRQPLPALLRRAGRLRRDARVHWLGRLAVAIGVALISLAALVRSPAASTPDGGSRTDYVIIAGAPGLRWDDLSPTGTPALWRLAQGGSIGALTVTSARRTTCPADGWVTLGAGNLAGWVTGPVAGRCPPLSVAITSPDHIGAFVAEQRRVVARSQEESWGARPGALAESVRCTVAVGPGAALAAARPIGRVDRYVERLPPDPAALLSECVLTIVDLGSISGSGAARMAAVRRADQTLGRLVAARPAASLVMVAGLADTDQPARLHVAIVDGPGFAGGWLASPSTGRSGYLQLFDLAPTALTALGKQPPAKLFAGASARRLDGRPDQLARAVGHLADADREAGAQRSVAGTFFLLLVVAQLIVLGLAAPILWRVRRGAGAFANRPTPPRLRRALEVALLMSGLAVPAALAADVVPWWRAGLPGLVFTLVWLALLGLTTAMVLASPLRRSILGLPATAAALAASIVGLDVIGGARLQLNGVTGYSALEGGRYAGIGTVGLGVLIAGVLLVAGALAQRVSHRWRPVVVAAVGAVGVIAVGSPYLGSDAAGAIALTAGVCVAAVMSTGGWLTTGRVLVACLAGLAVTGAFAWLELRRPAEQRGSLGQFLAAVGDGSAGVLIRRAGAANVTAVASSPLTVLSFAAGLFAFAVLMQPWGGLKRLFGIYPAIRAAAAGLVIAGLLGGLLNGAGLTVAGATAAISLPLITAAALRALVHADERTVAAATRAALPDVPADLVPPPGPVPTG